MGSLLGWIDFSPEHRDKVTRVIGLLSEPGTVDELGIGVIRNAFSNRLFPGLSTVQTRAKYLIIIPRILRDYDALSEREKRKYSSLAIYLQQSEDDCNKLLVSKHHGESELGIFGAENVAQNKLLQRMPSSVYWNGLRTFGLITTPLSLTEFLTNYQRRSKTDAYIHDSSETTRGDDEDAGDILLQPIKIPDANNGWKDELRIHLTSIEAEYLQSAVIQNARGSLLAYLLGDDSRMEELLRLSGNEFDSLLTLDCIKELKHIDEELYQTVQAASDFWRVTYGAHIRYNQLLQERNSGTPGSFDSLWTDWCDSIVHDHQLWNRWNTDWIWRLVSDNGSVLKPQVRTFVEGWSHAIEHGESKRLDEIVIMQENLNKGGRARLRSGGERVKEGEWVGISGLTYRVPTAWQIVKDILDGLDSKETS
ncbi:MAG: hypothetical protein GY814_03280 [Gammaproteobacteria bacterium]|nr:hypothetical protein [Gammaproteobacteria bacterium]